MDVCMRDQRGNTTRQIYSSSNINEIAATVLELINLVCFCDALSTGQLPFQIVDSVRIAAS
jgi:hypothetical protein